MFCTSIEEVVIPTTHKYQESIRIGLTRIVKLNNHWRPFTFKCCYCDINYDLIGRMETWNDDLDYIIQKRGLEKVLPFQKANISHHASNIGTKEITKEYFNTLSQKQKEDLYHMFRLDFEMFNYDPKLYS